MGAPSVTLLFEFAIWYLFLIAIELGLLYQSKFMSTPPRLFKNVTVFT